MPVDLRQCELYDRGTGHLLTVDGDRVGMVDTSTGELTTSWQPARALGYAYLLALAAESRNHVAGIMDGGEKGTFSGGTALWKPSLRIDPNTAESIRRRSRKTARVQLKAMTEALPDHERVAMRKGYRWRLGWKLVTLTMPHPRGSDTFDQIKLFNRAFRLFTKGSYFNQVYGGVKGVEDRLTASGPHVHGHFLLLSRYLDRQLWREEWKRCLDSAAEELGYALEYPSGDGLPILDVRRVVDKTGNLQHDEAGWDTALDEVSKYITKASDFLQPDASGNTIPPCVLFDLCDVSRYPRMFELLGKARKPPKPKPAEGGAFLDTSCISAGREPEPLPWKWIQERLGLEEPEYRTLILGENQGKDPPPDEDPPPKKGRVETWRELLKSLPWDQWMKTILERAERGEAFRLRWLKGNNPRLYLLDMAGNIRANHDLCYQEDGR
jgi:hypothetical protein